MDVLVSEAKVITHRTGTSSLPCLTNKTKYLKVCATHPLSILLYIYVGLYDASSANCMILVKACYVHVSTRICSNLIPSLKYINSYTMMPLFMSVWYACREWMRSLLASM